MIYEDHSAKIKKQLRGPIADFVGKVAMTTVRLAKLEVAGAGQIPRAVDTGRQPISVGEDAENPDRRSLAIR